MSGNGSLKEIVIVIVEALDDKIGKFMDHPVVDKIELIIVETVCDAITDVYDASYTFDEVDLFLCCSA